MPMSTPSGEKSYRFDQTVPEDVKKAMDECVHALREREQKLEELQQNVEILKDVLSHGPDECGYYDAVYWWIYKSIYANTTDLGITTSLLTVFLSSRLMRFLNFFGRWYIYDSDGYPHVNCPANEEFGKAPFLTRLGRWLRNHFPKRGE